MKGSKLISLICLLTVLLSVSGISLADTEFGQRIPTAYTATTGVGESDQGIPPDPYETFSYDLALLQAGLENFNVVYYTSVLPVESYEVSIETVKNKFHHGAVLEAIMAKAGGVKGDTVVAGIGRVWAVDEAGNKIGGFAAEYERVYKGLGIGPGQAKEDAIKQLTKSLDHELEIRRLKQDGDKKFNITSLNITKRYGIALAALGFLNYIYPDAITADTQ